MHSRRCRGSAPCGPQAAGQHLERGEAPDLQLGLYEERSAAQVEQNDQVAPSQVKVAQTTQS